MDLKDSMDTYRDTVKSAAYDVKATVQKRGNANGLRNRLLHTVSDTALAQPEIADFEKIVKDSALWKAMVDTCLLPYESYRAPRSAYEIDPEMSAQDIINGASVAKAYLQNLDEIHTRFPKCDGAKCGDGDACDMIDNTLAMVSRNIDIHFERSQNRKFRRKFKAYAQPAAWFVAAMAAGALDPHITHLSWLAAPALAGHALDGAAAVGVGFLVQQIVAYFNDRDAVRKQALEQTDVRNSIYTATLNAGNDIGFREERLLRLMEACINQAKSAKQKAWKRGDAYGASDDINKWLRLFDFFSARLQNLYAYVRGSGRLIDICFRASQHQALRDNDFVAMPDGFYGIPRGHFRAIWFSIAGLLGVGGGALFWMTHRNVDLFHDFAGSVFAAAGLAAIASCLLSPWRVGKVNITLDAPIDPELVKRLSANLVGKLKSGEATRKTNSLQREMTAMKDDLDLMEHDYNSGLIQARRGPVKSDGDDDGRTY